MLRYIKDKASKDYILVMKYASEGSLRNNLRSIAQMDWKDKINLLQCIASDLQIIHSHDLIHCDLHSGNILQSNLKSAYIADLELSITANIALKSKSDRICGILPYIAPEVLNNQQYTKASDIYSLGIIMWEILYVCNGLRPHIYENTAKCYANLMKKCWSTEPKERPTAAEICDIFAEWLNNESILFELFESNKLQNIKNEDMHVYNDSHYKSCFILSNNDYKDSELYELEVPDFIDE
ncbi:kinase-like domain-containing protein [Gigaspora rosea]|uniref:Kinase-like domain-containing protein n=1 Tax=Gigaspora rosea TaxID=44941 RepID=A0A397VVT5_9GLOM|nr:kinase-like domain-containing protein [Gigaspora rosea]